MLSLPDFSFQRLLPILALFCLFPLACTSTNSPCSRHSDCKHSHLRCALGRCVPAKNAGGVLVEPVSGRDASSLKIPEETREKLESCTSGAVRSCFDGPSSQAGRGGCFKGSQSCNSNGIWGECTGQGSPSKEVCNGVDDDCDGKVDNGLSRCVSTLAGTNDRGFVNGSLVDARFDSPSSLVVDSKGNLFVTDTLNHAIRKVTPNGTVSTFAGTGKQGFKDGQGTDAMFARPGAIAIDKSDNLYIADTINHRIRKITPDGVVSTLAGQYPGQRDGKGSAARLYSPSGIAIDAKGVLYVGDTLNHAIRKITPDGVVSTLAGSGSPGMEDGAAKTAAFNMPLGVALNSDGSSLYVADSANHRIARVDTVTGFVDTHAGGNPRGFQNGPADKARFYLPLAVVVDKLEQVYVADLSNNVIRLISSLKQVSTFVGNGQRGFKDGAGKDAQFYSPSGLTFDQHGHLILADFFNHRIRRIVVR